MSHNHSVYPIPEGVQTPQEDQQVSPQAANGGRHQQKRFSTCSERSLSRAERNVVNYIQTSQTPDSTRTAIIRSNSYTLQDVEKQRRSIQASMEGMPNCDPCEDDPNFRYYHSLSTLKGRRVSKSLPELNHLRHFPLVNTRYQSEVDESSDDDDDDESRSVRDIPEKTAWRHKTDFIFTGIVWALGLNNLWRFPYYCFRFPAGSFLFAYIVSTIVVGVPLLTMEYALGQLTRRGPIAALGGLCPLLKGVPVAAAILCLASAPLLSTISSWSLFYFFKSFYQNPLWSLCTNPWNTDKCSKDATITTIHTITTNLSRFIETDPDFDDEEEDIRIGHVSIQPGENFTTTHPTTTSNVTLTHQTTTEMDIPSPLIETSFSNLVSPTQEFFDHKLLELEVGTTTWSQIQWELILFVFATWMIVFVVLRRKILFSSKRSSCFSLIPYVILLVLFTRALTFEGAKKGILYFLRPSWEDLLNSEMWMYACSLSIHSLGCVIGVSFAQATCNRERNNFLWDAFVIAFINVTTVTFVGLILFSTLGHLSYKRNVHLASVVVRDPGVAFVAFSELLSSIPFAPFWSVVFFFALFCLGVDHQTSLLRAFFVAIEDAYGSHVKKNFLAHQVFAFLICFFSFLSSLFFLTEKGILMIQAFDLYLTTIMILILAFFEVILMGWFYGGSNLAQVIKLKIAKTLGFFFPFSWIFLTPISILGVLTWCAVSYHEPLFRDSYRFPPYMHSIIVGLAILLLLIIPIVGYLQVLKTPKGTFFTRVINACRPFEKETPNVPLVNESEENGENVQNQTSQVSNGNIRRPSILEIDWTKQKSLNEKPNEEEAPTTKPSSVYQRLPVSITLSLIQGLDRETEI